jgi:hypothetical protein
MDKIDSNITSYLNNRLNHWAKWFVYHGDFGLGFPHKSREGQLIDGGGISIRSTSHYIPSNSMAEETENLVKELANQNARLAEALREYYFGAGNMVYKAQHIGVSASHFKVYVDMAKYWLIGRLSQQQPWRKSTISSKM